jgi:hypothetical protein
MFVLANARVLLFALFRWTILPDLIVVVPVGDACARNATETAIICVDVATAMKIAQNRAKSTDDRRIRRSRGRGRDRREGEQMH